jgi:hypothetical protein
MNNPIKLVDPNGMEVIIGGEAAAAYYAEVKKGAKALGISVKMDKNGLLSAKYKGKGPISENGQMVLDAVNSKDVTVNINATNSDKADGNIMCGGAFMGNQFKENGGVNTFQTVNPNDLKKIDDFYGTPGQTSIHELTESYQGGLISLKTGEAAKPAIYNVPNPIYEQAHNAATPQPFSKIDKYEFDRAGIQSKISGRPAVSRGYYFPDTDIQIKQVSL